ncbi:MAG TPA: PEP-CTERM sorting domain-containing protein, partial [Gemmataceae bacterium]|nr:PEP-CTERM sorting domain-containing protein [Gemmataceae bacterium]
DGTAFNAQNSPSDHFLSFTNESNHPIVVPFVSGYNPFSSPLPVDQANTILATNINGVSSAPKSNKDSWDFNYLLTVTLTGNKGPGDFALMSFTGHIQATAYNETVNGEAFTFYNLKDTPTSPRTQSTMVDGNQVYINLPTFASNTLGSTNNGAAQGYIWAVPSLCDCVGTLPASPEPSTLVLSFLGLSGLGIASWRQWRARGGVLSRPRWHS